MSTVTIKGRITTTMLRQGEEATVERTSTIDNLVREGYVEVIAETEPEPEKVRVPSRSASRKEWAEFMSGRGFEFDDDASRADLIDQWDQFWVDTSDAETFDEV